MALVPCPECMKTVSEHAAACPACGIAISAEAMAMAKQALKDRDEAQTKKILLAFLVLPPMFLFLPIALLEGCRSATPSLRQNASVSTVGSHTDDKKLSIPYAKNAVKERLKSPSSASFPWGSDNYKVSNLGDRWMVSGYVDAENGFGAKIRRHWIVELEKDHSFGDFVVQSVVFL
ncbi:hypothetical protein Pla52o_03030 [Novipirellula galeiformis]|uniref:Zinc ribbon domain-containing protein n=1 Tax=Novipirellula galeiformis TaxID=2528004 RepID=A0A5C6CPI9_9BACT|nr:hypothetical protein [Novipirellula galeiformis]TWU26450.1 hypothetical protein Pla52o_03030 [Novipirellula galeiformis]